MAFVCLTPAALLDGEEPKALGKDAVQAALNELDFEDSGKLVICLDGGGIAASGLGKTPELAVVGPFIAVLGGSLSNYAYLVRKYCLEELGLPSTISLEAVRERTPIREAALLCKLYDRLGSGMLTKLRGKFAFALYDSTCGRVLAARDASGAMALTRGRTDDGFLFVASGECRPSGAIETSTIGPGKFVYGFGEERKFCNPEEEVTKFAAQATSAALEALKGIKLELGSRARSLDCEVMRERKGVERGRRRSASDRAMGGHARGAHPGGEFGQWRASAGGAPKGSTGRRSGGMGVGRRIHTRGSIEAETWRSSEEGNRRPNWRKGAGSPQGGTAEGGDARSAEKPLGQAAGEANVGRGDDAKGEAHAAEGQGEAKAVGDTGLVSVH